MELMTPQILWKDFDTQAPFDETFLRNSVENGRTVKEFYFSGMRTSDGVIRIFARYLHNGDELPTIVYFGELNEPLDIPEVTSYNFLVADYAGLRSGKTRGTIYPYSLSDATADELAEGVPPKNSRWYAWASVAMSTVLYATKNCGSGKVGVIGAGQGGSLVWKLSACVGADAAVTLFSTGYEPTMSDIAYRACLDNRSYAPILKFPVMEIVSSNEEDGSIDFMSEIFGAIKRKDCRFCINERTNHMLGDAGKRNVTQWLRRYLYGEGKVPEYPTLRTYESGGKMYYEVRYNGEPDEITLFISIGDVHGAVRNWSVSPLIKLEDCYLSTPAVYDANAPVNAFVTVKELGYKVSSVILSRVPAKMGITPTPVKRNRLVYDSEMGIDDWTTLAGDKPDIKNGPFDISGVFAGKPVTTFKLADVRYKGEDGELLQVMFCSRVRQTVKFVITDSSRRTFTAAVEAELMQGWVTKNFVAEDFKAQNEQTLLWNDIVTFEVVPESGPVLIASILWV